LSDTWFCYAVVVVVVVVVIVVVVVLSPMLWSPRAIKSFDLATKQLALAVISTRTTHSWEMPIFFIRQQSRTVIPAVQGSGKSLTARCLCPS